jgi:hypothetical protein
MASTNSMAIPNPGLTCPLKPTNTYSLFKSLPPPSHPKTLYSRVPLTLSPHLPTPPPGNMAREKNSEGKSGREPIHAIPCGHVPPFMRDLRGGPLSRLLDPPGDLRVPLPPG